MCVWESMSPGRTVARPRSMTVAPSGALNFPRAPTSLIRSPSIRIAASFTGAAAVPSMSVPARTSVTGAGACFSCALSAAAARPEGRAGVGDAITANAAARERSRNFLHLMDASPTARSTRGSWNGFGHVADHGERLTLAHRRRPEDVEDLARERSAQLHRALPEEVRDVSDERPLRDRVAALGQRVEDAGRRASQDLAPVDVERMLHLGGLPLDHSEMPHHALHPPHDSRHCLVVGLSERARL